MPTNKKYKPSTDPTKPQLFYFLPAIAWAGLIVYFSLMPGDNVPQLLNNLNDKIVHMLIYFTSASLIYLGFIRFNFSSPIKATAIWANLAICVLLGAIIEVLQQFWVVNRTGDWQDFLANTIGSLLSVLILRFIHGYRA